MTLTERHSSSSCTCFVQYKYLIASFIWRSLVVLDYLLLHTKFQDQRKLGSGEDFLKVFTIYGHGGHLGHVTMTVWKKLPWRLHNWASIDPVASKEEKMFANVDGRRHDVRRTTDDGCLPIRRPRSDAVFCHRTQRLNRVYPALHSGISFKIIKMQ